MNNKYILEALKMQPLSEEEKAARHILGRLYGPIATCKEKTRNGRGYNRDLWEKALADEVFNEKVANKSLFLELGHPVDREETDMEKVCACIPELPKIVDDDLYAYVDILDTKNGRLLKTLCDYGFIPGISSRGSGDIMPDDNVDPETFFLETWDIVQLPAVKKARLTVCESMDTNVIKLKKALAESYNAADAEEKKLIKETLDNLNISLDETVDDTMSQDDLVIEVPMSQDEGIDQKSPLLESDDDTISEIETDEEDEEIIESDDEEIVVEDEDDDSDDIPAADEADIDVDADTEEDTTEKTTDDEVATTDNESVVSTVEDFINEFADFDKQLNLEFNPIIIDGKEYKVTNFDLEDVDDKLVINIDYDSEKSDDIESVEDDSTDEQALDTEDPTEEVIDDESDDVMESFKDLIRQKDLLESEIKTLKAEKAVSDTEVNELREGLNKYKLAFMRTSELASNTKQLKTTNKQLVEKLNAQNGQIKDLTAELKSAKTLTESTNVNNAKLQSLTEKLEVMQQEKLEVENKLADQVGAYKRKLDESIQTAKSYKMKFQAVLNKYIDSKATMLGVKPVEITKKLSESYTLADIDKICDDILSANSYVSNLPFGSTAKIKINESVTSKSPEFGYDIDDDLLTLAGLK